MKGYRSVRFTKSAIGGIETLDGETIEQKMERVVNSKEPITDGAPIIYTERKDGVIAAYNIRTDRFEIAAEAMDKVSGSIAARREERAKARDAKVVDLKDSAKGDVSPNGTDGSGEGVSV